MSIKDGKTTVTHYLIENPDRSASLLQVLEETKGEVVRLMDEHQNTKVAFSLKVYFANMIEVNEVPALFKKHLNSEQVRVAPKGENEEVYEVIRKRIERAFELLKMENSGFTIDHIELGEVTF